MINVVLCRALRYLGERITMGSARFQIDPYQIKRSGQP